MKRIFSWFNKRGLLLVISCFVLAIITEVLFRKEVLNVDVWNISLSMMFFFAAIGLFLFGLLIFGPLYRKFDVQKLRTIEKGKHYPKRVRWPLFIAFSSYFRIELRVRFDPSCIYKFNNNNNHDRNKLFGLSFTLLPRIRHRNWIEGGDVRIWFSIGNYIVIKPHHWNSIRFVWNIAGNGVQLLIAPYVFKQGKRMYKHHFSDNAGETLWFDTDIYYRFVLNVRKEVSEVRMIVYDNSGRDLYLDFDKVFMKVPRWMVMYYYLDLYFGGNQSASHTMYLEQQQIID